jgi:hypothetical protein
MTESMNFIKNLAKELDRNGNTMSGAEVVTKLNNMNLKTQRGTRYKFGRGVYTLIRATYWRLVEDDRKTEADMVADAFTNAQGEPAWQ